MDQTQIMTSDKYGTRRNDSSSEMNLNCCICFKEINNFKLYMNGGIFNCETCSSGLVCSDCYINNWNFIEDDFERRYKNNKRMMWLFCRQAYECDIEIKEILEKVIKCPCCRTLNWKMVYTSIFNCLGECDRLDIRYLIR